jgi:hypothetical protein
MVPFLFCIFFVVLPQVYLVEIYRRGWNVGSPLKTLDMFFFKGGFSWGHLWFLLLLFIFTALHFPVFSALMSTPSLALGLVPSVMLALAFLALPHIAVYSPGLGAFVVAAALTALAFTLLLRRALWHLALCAVAVATVAALTAHVFDLPALGAAWASVYAVLMAAGVLAAALAPRGWAGVVAAAGIVLAASMHVAAVAGPEVLPSASLATVGGLRLADVLYMIAHFTPFFAVGFACAAFAGYLAASPLLVGAARWLGVGVLAAIPLVAVTLPLADGYVILVGNFPTYEAPMHRLLYHLGAWLWIGILAAAAHVGCTQSPNEAVRLTLSGCRHED